MVAKRFYGCWMVTVGCRRYNRSSTSKGRFKNLFGGKASDIDIDMDLKECQVRKNNIKNNENINLFDLRRSDECKELGVNFFE